MLSIPSLTFPSLATRFLPIVAVFSWLVLGASLAMQWGLDLVPCPMCIVQRYAIMALAVLATLAWATRKGSRPLTYASHLPAGCPRVGVVWVFINLYGDWTGTVRFDPRDASAIVWHPRPNPHQAPRPAQWSLDVSLPCATPLTQPHIASNWDSMAERYDDWVQEHYRPASDIQIGGWVWPIQGDFDDRQETFVCAMERQSFGDSGAVYLHFSLEEGFFVHVETC